MVIKLDVRKSFTVSTAPPALPKTFSDRNADARSVCDSLSCFIAFFSPPIAFLWRNLLALNKFVTDTDTDFRSYMRDEHQRMYQWSMSTWWNLCRSSEWIYLPLSVWIRWWTFYLLKYWQPALAQVVATAICNLPNKTLHMCNFTSTQSNLHLVSLLMWKQRREIDEYLMKYSYLRQGIYVFTCVCLYVCLFVCLFKNHWSNLYELYLCYGWT